MGATLTTLCLSAPDPRLLAHFYRDLLGYEVAEEETGWVLLRDPAGGVGLSFQTEPEYVRPVWPGGPGDQRMMMHLEVRVPDLRTGVARAVDLGALLADFQPQGDVRVCLDPAGHPFCLWAGEEERS